MVRPSASVDRNRSRIRTLRIVLGVALVAITLIAPKRAFAASGWQEALGSIWPTLACILRPTGTCGQAPVEIGCGIDPNGLCVPAPLTIGCGIDPNGKCLPPQEIGCGLDPGGLCRP